MKHTISLLLIFGLFGCATPTKFTDKPMKKWDSDTEYAIEENAAGFVLTVEYSKHQFIPETDAVRKSCLEAITFIAKETADERKKELETIDPSRIRVSTGRNGLSGNTSCSATGRFFYRGASIKESVARINYSVSDMIEGFRKGTLYYFEATFLNEKYEKAMQKCLKSIPADSGWIKQHCVKNQEFKHAFDCTDDGIRRMVWFVYPDKEMCEKNRFAIKERMDAYK